MNYYSKFVKHFLANFLEIKKNIYLPQKDNMNKNLDVFSDSPPSMHISKMYLAQSLIK